MSKYGIILTTLATELAEAMNKDQESWQSGSDVSEGLFGDNVSEWLRETAEALSDEKRPKTYIERIMK